MPNSLEKHINREDILLFVKARWNEHLIETVLLSFHDGPSSSGHQALLMRHRLARAQLEAKLYGAAIQAESNASEAYFSNLPNLVLKPLQRIIARTILAVMVASTCTSIIYPALIGDRRRSISYHR